MAYKNRAGWKPGKWLVIDEESGLTRYNTEVRTDYRGLYVTHRYADEEQPQDFVKPLDDPKPLPFTRTPNRDFEVCDARQVIFVGDSTVLTQTHGPANHLFDVGIGEAQVENTFLIR